MSPISLSALGKMDAAALRIAIATLDHEAADLHLSDDGTPRNLTKAEEDQLDAKLVLRNRAEAHLHMREQFNRTSPQPSMATYGNGASTSDGRFGEARRTIDTAARSG